MEHQRTDRFTLDPAIAHWASVSVQADQSARTLGSRPITSLALSAALTLTCPPAFVAAAGLRITSFAGAFRQPKQEPSPMHPRDELPTYSVLVPLYREADIVPDLADRMLALDYPLDQLEVLILLEEDDAGTIASARHHMSRAPFRVVVVPDGRPRTKPRACNFGLGISTGECVVIYDGEDRPEPDQLIRAAKALAADSKTAVVQCRLAADHAEISPWITKMWALDYDLLFTSILPTLSKLKLPFLIGGTSNHFRREALLAVGGWDAHNVTEDADLAVRLARAGWRSGFIDSVTWEEAPLTLRAWMHQRSRWLKGFMVTTLVHGCQPIRLAKELGAAGTIALFAQLPAALLSIAAYPISLGALALGYIDPTTPRSWLMASGHLSTVILAFRVARSRGRSPGVRPGLVGLLPIYWLMLAGALCIGLFEMPRRASLWRKTAHGVAKRPQVERLLQASN